MIVRRELRVVEINGANDALGKYFCFNSTKVCDVIHTTGTSYSEIG